MPDDILIRPIQPSDLQAYIELRLQGLQAHPEAFGSDYSEHLAEPQSTWIDRINGSIEGKTSRLVVAEAGGALCGMAGVARNRGIKVQHGATLVSVYCKPAWRGKHLADRLIQACIDWCTANEVRTLRLGVATCNVPAIRCYQRCGFQIYGIEPDSIRVDDVYHDEFLMSRRCD